MMTNSFPRLDDRARGWLRFIWDKATTQDDWSVNGEPHPWWDRHSTPPMCSLARFDLHETGYVLPVMSDVTPAWRECYTTIADELVQRHTTFQAVIDWITMIGHDPNRDRYPPEWQVYLPEHLRGRYDAPGWTGNGIEPWGLQPDPIGADGALFIRGFFNLLLGFHRYVSGDDKWCKPFKMVGYQERLFEWDHHRIASFIHEQWLERPQGAQCENTKIWPFCISGAGLGLKLYDGVYGTNKHVVYDTWIEYARDNYMGFDKKGNLDWFAFYYDPIERAPFTLRDDLSAYCCIAITLYVLPMNREFGTFLYEMAVRKLGWNDPRKALLQLHPDPRWLTLGIVCAREVGDHVTENRLRELAEASFEPRFFGEDNDRFGWFFGNGELWPRGQLASLMILSELGEPGSWLKVFNEPNLAKFSEPTVSGVDYPALGISQCWNDLDAGVLWVETYCATTSKRGEATAWQISGIPDTAEVRVIADEGEFTGWVATGANSIEIRSDVNTHQFRIETGFRHGSKVAASFATEAQSQESAIISAPDSATVASALASASCGSSCC